MNENQTQNPDLTLTLAVQEVNVIFSILQEIPYKLAKPLLDKILPQVQAQVNDSATETVQ